MDLSADPLVVGKDGLRGRLVSTQPGAEPLKDRTLLELEDGQQLYVPINALQQQEDGSYYLPLSTADLRQAYSQDSHGPETVLTVPVIAEQIMVEKRLVETGRTRIHKQVLEQEQVVDEPLMSQEVAIDHVPINQVWEGEPPPVRYEGETLVIPLLEEVLVVEKRLMLKEELRIRRVDRTVHAPQTVTLRREEVTVERVELASEQANDDITRN
jgi:uncharacterized protein (TIGR02271 family)